jgi:hypothetical protein
VFGNESWNITRICTPVLPRAISRGLPFARFAPTWYGASWQRRAPTNDRACSVWGAESAAGTAHAGGVFYSLDPSRRRLSGALGRLLVPKLMKRYQTVDERELEAEPTAALFRRAGWETQVAIYDFGSSPLAGLLPGWGVGYRMARRVDDVVLRVPGMKRLGSNFEVIARA